MINRFGSFKNKYDLDCQSILKINQSKVIIFVSLMNEKKNFKLKERPRRHDIRTNHGRNCRRDLNITRSLQSLSYYSHFFLRQNFFTICNSQTNQLPL